jgi:hypothetical protein
MTSFAATAAGIGVSIVQGVSIDGDAGVAKTSLDRPLPDVEVRPDEESPERQRDDVMRPAAN